MRAADTNVVVRLLVRDDEGMAKAAEAFVERGAWVSHVVLVEVLWVLGALYDRTPLQLAGVVEVLLAHEHLALQDSGVVEQALARFREDPGLGFADCLILETARQAGHLPLGTLDRRLAKADGAQPVRGRA
jgi:predicted nucleic acid-binding protein